MCMYLYQSRMKWVVLIQTSIASCTFLFFLRFVDVNKHIMKPCHKKVCCVTKRVRGVSGIRGPTGPPAPATFLQMAQLIIGVEGSSLSVGTNGIFPYRLDTVPLVDSAYYTFSSNGLTILQNGKYRATATLSVGTSNACRIAFTTDGVTPFGDPTQALTNLSMLDRYLVITNAPVTLQLVNNGPSTVTLINSTSGGSLGTFILQTVGV